MSKYTFRLTATIPNNKEMTCHFAFDEITERLDEDWKKLLRKITEEIDKQGEQYGQ